LEDEIYHPTTRVLTVLELLQSRGQMAGSELASRLEVELRTVRRYIAMLQDMGIPVEATRGPGGGYRLKPGFKLPPLIFTDDEALAITFSLLTARRQGIPVNSHALEGVLAKIERVLPEKLRFKVQALQASVMFVSQPVSNQPQSEWVLLFSSAVQGQRRVYLRYRSWQDETERAIDPYGIVLHQGKWYVVGWCHLRQSVRVFRLDHMLEVHLQATTFQAPEHFNSLEFVLNSFPTAKHGWAVEVLIETTLEDAQKLIPVGIAVLNETVGGVLFRSQVERLEWLARLMLTWERPFVVKQPRALRDALRALATQANHFAERES
jgi:predicted DNA-binding transcriptional regulator YafY